MNKVPPFWTLPQTIAWIVFRDEAVFSFFDDDRRRKTGEGPWSITAMHFDLLPRKYAHPESKRFGILEGIDNTFSPLLDDAERDLLGALSAGDLRLIAKRLNVGEPGAVPADAFLSLKFFHDHISQDEPFAGYSQVPGKGESWWGTLRFRGDEVRKAWPAAGYGRVRRQGGRPPAADWDALKICLRAEIDRAGFPAADKPPGWQKTKDVVAWMIQLRGANLDHVSQRTIEGNIRKMLQAIQSAGLT